MFNELIFSLDPFEDRTFGIFLYQENIMKNLKAENINVFRISTNDQTIRMNEIRFVIFVPQRVIEVISYSSGNHDDTVNSAKNPIMEF